MAAFAYITLLYTTGGARQACSTHTQTLLLLSRKKTEIALKRSGNLALAAVSLF